MFGRENNLDFDFFSSTQIRSEISIQKNQNPNQSVGLENSLQVEKNLKKAIEIKSHFASISNGKLIKVTEIEIKGRLVRVIDSFTQMDQQDLPAVPKIQPKSSGKQSHSYKNLLKKKSKPSPSSDQSENSRKKDVKNVVKNIFKLFQYWVKEHFPSGNQISPLLQTLVKKNRKFNNSLISMIANDERIQKPFICFATNAGEEFIQKSNIKDKRSHLEALHHYNNICQLKETNQKEKERTQKEFDEEKRKMEENDY